MNTETLYRYALILVAGMACSLAGCGGFPPDNGGGQPNPPEGEARYVGASACLSCHPVLCETHLRTGHSQALKPVEDAVPTWPQVDTHPGIPGPPTGTEWSEIAWIIDGYRKSARFVKDTGYVMTDGTEGTETEYEFAVPPIGTEAGYAPYMPDRVEPLPFEYEVFRRRTTGPQTLADNGGRRQNGRPGVEGTWFEAGVQCESCHGPGSLHLPAPELGNINVATADETCAECHADPADPLRIPAEDWLIVDGYQYAEVAASPHGRFGCTMCHDPHVSPTYDRDIAIRNECTACHADQNMAFHQGLVFEWGDYTEEVTCESCHMAYAVKNSSSNIIELSFGLVARLGDTRSHIMRIQTNADSALDMFTDDGTEVARDAAGQASLTACYVCQRCHNGLGNAFPLTPREGCSLGGGIHGE